MDYDPLAVMAVALLTIVLAVRGLVSSQGRSMSNLINSVTSLAESVAKLEVLYRDQLIHIVNSVDRQEGKQDDMEKRLATIETEIENCEEKRNGNT